GRINYFTQDKERELLELKDKWGFTDPRNTKEYENCDICANDIFRDSWEEAGVERRAFDAPPPMRPTAAAASSAGGPVDQESLIQEITSRVVAALRK
ncbi:MAG: class II aldolase/adducin family protein, partial [Planctomycetales bacterium]|nr:class II aldolase/adducin family protein [Planctomycetales bacterium]